MLEIIQHELLSQRQKQAEIDDINTSFSTLLAKDPGTGLNPNIAYQKRALDKINSITQETVSRMQAAKDDPYKMRRAEQEYTMAINSDPDILGAKREAATLEKYGEHYMRLQEKGFVNNEKVKLINSEINREDRDKPITFETLDLGSISKDIYDIGKEILDDRQTKNSIIERDENGRIVAERTNTTLVLPGETELEAKERTRKYLVERLRPDFPDKKDKELEAIASNIVEDRFLKNSGQDYSGVKGSPTPRATAKTADEKFSARLWGDGVKAYSGGAVRIQGDPESDEIYLYNAANESLGTAEENWDNLSEGDKNSVRRSGRNYDKYQVSGSNKKINGMGIDTNMTYGGLSEADAQFATESGMGSKVNIGDGYIETNNPAVLDRLGLTLKYDKKGGKDKTGAYYMTDSGGKRYEEGTIFTTSGGAKYYGPGAFGNIDEEISAPKMFQIKIKNIEAAQDSGTTTPKADNPAPAPTPAKGTSAEEQSVEIDGFVFKKSKDGKYQYESEKDFPGSAEDVEAAWNKKYGKSNPPADSTKQSAPSNPPKVDTTKQSNVPAADPWKFKKTDSTPVKINYEEPAVKKDTTVTPPKAQDSNVGGLYNMGGYKSSPGTTKAGRDRYGNVIKPVKVNVQPAKESIRPENLPEPHVEGNRQSEEQWKQAVNPSDTNFEVKFSQVEKDTGVKIKYDSTDVKDAVKKGYFSDIAANAITDLAKIGNTKEIRVTGFIHHISRDKRKPNNFDLGMNEGKGDSMKGMFEVENGKITGLLGQTERWMKKHGYALVIENDSYRGKFDDSSIYLNLEKGGLYFRPEAKKDGVSRGPHYSFEYVGTTKTKR